MAGQAFNDASSMRRVLVAGGVSIWFIAHADNTMDDEVIAGEPMAERDRFPVVVHVLVYEGESFVLLKRANTGFMDGYYALPGGHQQTGESVSQAAHRECAEELGIRTRVLVPECVLPYRSGRHQGVNFIFSCRDYEGAPLINEPDLFDELCWVGAERLPAPHAEWIPWALELAGGSGWYRELEWD